VSDIDILREAWRLEDEAVERYTRHRDDASDPRLIAYWEALRRNESEHRDELTERIAAGVNQIGETAVSGDTGSTTSEGAHSEGAHSEGAHSDDNGYRSALADLRADLEFERNAVKAYGTFAGRVESAELKQMFKSLARAEGGHVRGLRSLIETFRADDVAVIFTCPICGWQVDFGQVPEEGTERTCPMCGRRFALRRVDGDWALALLD